MIYIGIDPGLDGAVAVIDGSGIYFSDVPTLEVRSGKKEKTDV